MVTAFKVHWDVQLCTHAALAIDIQVPPRECGWMRLAASLGDGPAGPDWPEQREASEQGFCSSYGPVIRLAAGDIAP